MDDERAPPGVMRDAVETPPSSAECAPVSSREPMTIT
jgi:hypothetical protein